MSTTRRLAWLVSLGVCATFSAALADEQEAGAVLVRPLQISDAPGSGSPALPAGQDGDGFPDTDETVDLVVELSNKWDVDLTNVVVRLWSFDTKVACISSNLLSFGTVRARASRTGAVPFRFRVASSADRGGTSPPATCAAGECSNGAGACASAADCARSVTDVYAARFSATVSADQLPPSGETDAFDVELDLDAVNAPVATTTQVEGFESGFGSYIFQNLDAGLASNTLSNGMRCQYNDPDDPNSGTYGDSQCYLGSATQSPVNDWHSHTSSSPDGGRAFAGNRSLHWGRHSVPGFDTYAFAQMDAVRTISAIRLAARVCHNDTSPNPKACSVESDCLSVGGGPCVPARPELSFKQQAALYEVRDDIHLDRAIVQARISSSPVWQKLTPYWNVHDGSVTRDWVGEACSFDPIDDGNDEDDYFPAQAQPFNYLGPSSTCYPEFAFGTMGDTGLPYSPTRIGAASDGPGLPGSLGVGTWVESRYDLSRFRGRAIQLRYLITSVVYDGSETYQDFYHFNPYSGDDGWYVDDIRVSQTIGSNSATVTLDTSDRSFLPGCAGPCAVTASLLSTPAALPAPGNTTELSAAGSSAVGCPAGDLRFEFWKDTNADGVFGPPPDWVMQAASFDELFDVYMNSPLQFGVRVRCDSVPACADDATVLVPVNCPVFGVYTPYAWWAKVRGFTYHWEPTIPHFTAPYFQGQRVDWVRGSLSILRSSGSFGGVTCVANDASSPEIYDTSEDPPEGDAYYYVMRGMEPYCHETPSYRTFHPEENPGDATKRDRELTACPPP